MAPDVSYRCVAGTFTNLAGVLNNYQVTVLAPSNKAFLKAPAAFKDYGKAQQIMGYHVFSGFNAFAALKSAPVGKKVSAKAWSTSCTQCCLLRCCTSSTLKEILRGSISVLTWCTASDERRASSD